jgi:hypothetical protein
VYRKGKREEQLTWSPTSVSPRSVSVFVEAVSTSISLSLKSLLSLVGSWSGGD